mmetsp:Transcript_20260/g.30212  ORF Transcript_20260/g.30212 Transcript_20260/m.30212 type:complete len:300 (-) Transcript_20260:942-1841(-)
MKDDIQIITEESNGLMQTLYTALDDVHQHNVEKLSSLSSEYAIPKFQESGIMWMQLCSSLDALKIKQNVFRSIESEFSSLAQNDFSKQGGQSLSKMEQISHQDLATHEITDEIAVELSNMGNGTSCWLRDNIPLFRSLPIEYHGICIWTAIRSDGMIVDGKPNLGAVRFNGRHYIFDSIIGLKEFLRDPSLLLSQFRSIVLDKPELIYFLNLQNEFPNVRSMFQSLLQLEDDVCMPASITACDNKEACASSQSDACVETPVHFVESYIDPNYCWNEWDIRRRIIQIADERRRNSASTNT